MIKPSYYWDSCIFIAHLNGEHHQHGAVMNDISQFLEEAAAGDCTIYCSTITIAEIPESAFERNAPFSEFLRDFQNTVVPVDPGPAIMRLAAHLRSQPYEKQGSKRRLATPDAIHLATAVALKDYFGVDLSGFHTFDTGKRRGEEGGKGIPLIGYESWCGSCSDDDVVKKVIAIKRSQPLHPSPRMT
ncbi:MAG TPA: hypothetical protein VGN79_12505 [Devosia sp.]|nr:hypothetical protein [Devosia sp.]